VPEDEDEHAQPNCIGLAGFSRFVSVLLNRCENPCQALNCARNGHASIYLSTGGGFTSTVGSGNPFQISQGSTKSA